MVFAIFLYFYYFTGSEVVNLCVNKVLFSLLFRGSKLYISEKRTALNSNYNIWILLSICSGLVAATISTPADVVKTRIMNNPSLYKGSIDCLKQAVSSNFIIMQGTV